MWVYFKMMLLNLESQMQYKISFVMTVIGQFVTAFTGFIGIKFMFDYMDSVGEFEYEQGGALHGRKRKHI